MEPARRQPLRAGAASGRVVLVADAASSRRDRQEQDAKSDSRNEERLRVPGTIGRRGKLADAETSQTIARSGKAKARTEPQDGDRSGDGRDSLRLAHAEHARLSTTRRAAAVTREDQPHERLSQRAGDRGKLVHAASARLPQRTDYIENPREDFLASARERPVKAGHTSGFWRDTDWILRKKWGSDDPEWCPTEPGTFPLAYGVPARVGRLRGYGNAIVPQVAAAFVEACAVR